MESSQCQLLCSHCLFVLYTFYSNNHHFLKESFAASSCTRRVYRPLKRLTVSAANFTNPRVASLSEAPRTNEVSGLLRFCIHPQKYELNCFFLELIMNYAVMKSLDSKKFSFAALCKF